MESLVALPNGIGYVKRKEKLQNFMGGHSVPTGIFLYRNNNQKIFFMLSIGHDPSSFFFYNYILKCFVIVELKTNKITHQDIGQLDMYVRMYDDVMKPAGDNPTIGILLCTETDHTIARYSVLKENKQLFATKYMPYLPTEEELKAEIEKQKEILAIKMKGKGNE